MNSMLQIQPLHYICNTMIQYNRWDSVLYSEMFKSIQNSCTEHCTELIDLLI